MKQAQIDFFTHLQKSQLKGYLCIIVGSFM